MLTQNKKDVKKKLKISELSDLLKIKKSTIKFWEKELSLPTAESHLYSEKEIALFKEIKKLIQEEALSLKQVKEALETHYKETTSSHDSFTPAQTDETAAPMDSNSYQRTTSEQPNMQENNKTFSRDLSENTITISPSTPTPASIQTVSTDHDKHPKTDTSKQRDTVAHIKCVLLSMKEKLNK